ncbi:hypothetical protein NQ095_11745 [Rossellomorea sp. SC111]|uniref:hypothetical protein n=1 Tax=Rossellomorea sp. SC111 TaxID=2968985 RepID=UPI00215AA303|nr:hypothetical protein [Rossellomorea sp. SC111]MCR8849085.1 hypothetical protein [Rossellomorea sp. SC111]
MGYIAPIPHYQYKQYQEREIKVDKHHFSFFPLQPIKPLKNNSQAHPEGTSEHVPHSDQVKAPYEKLSKPSVPSTLLAQLTGKGTHFSEYV